MEPTPEDLLRMARERGELDEEEAGKAEEILKRGGRAEDVKTFAGTLIEEGLVTSDTAHTLLQVLGEDRDEPRPHPASDTQAPVPRTHVADPVPSGDGEGDPESPLAKPSRATSRKFRKGKRLGVGGMGEVVEATDPDLQRLVAIKTVLDPGLSARRGRFLKEAHITGQLEHPNIIPVYELGFEENSAPYMVMKKVKGHGLDEVLGSVSATGSIDPDGEGAGEETGTSKVTEVPDTPEKSLAWLLGVFVKVCEAVAFAHSRKVIHRDLKPENIMVGEFGEVLVMDWGLAKVIGKPDTAEDQLLITEEDWNPDGVARTLDGTVVGTPAYMPPEQADGMVEKLDERSDVYSLGAILYEILALAPPFQGETVYKILHGVLLGNLVRPSEKSLAPWEVPRDLEAVVMKAMSRDPKRRYASALELRDEVAAFFAGRRLSAATYSASELLRMWAARNRAAVSTGLAMAAVLIVATVLFVLSLTRARNEALDQKDLAQTAEKAARVAESTARQAESTAREAEAEARNQAERAETLRHAAEVRAAEGLILQADALLAADRRADAEARYVEARAELKRLKEDPEGAVWGLMQVCKTSPPPLLEVRIQGDAHSQVAFSPDGKTFLTSGRWDTKPTLWETFSGRTVRTYSKVRGTRRIAFLRDGSAFLAAKGKDIHAIDVATGDLRRTYRGHGGEVSDLSLFEDGLRFVSAASDRTVRVWDIATGKTERVLTDPRQAVLSVAVSPDGKSVVTYGDKCEAVVWNLGDGRELNRIDPLPGWAYGHVSFVWGGRSFMVSSGSLMRRFDLYPNLRVQNFIELGRNIRGIVPTPDGLRVITAGDQRRVKIWDLYTGEVESWRYGHTDRIGGLALSKDGARLVTVGADHVIRIWNVREGEERDLYRGHARPPTRISVTPDDRLAASGSPMGIVRLWDVESGCEIMPLFGFVGEVLGVALSPMGRRVAAYGPQGLAVWETALPDAEPRWLVGPGGPGMTWADFSRDGKRLLTSGKDDRVWILWDAERGDEIVGVPLGEGSRAAVAVFRPGETQCVAAMDDGTLTLWDLQAGRELKRAKVVRSQVPSLDVSEDGRQVLVGDDAGKIALWDLETGAILRAVSDREISVENAAFVPGTTRFVTSHFDDEIRLWDRGTGKERLRTRGCGHKAYWIAPLSDGRRFLVSRRSSAVELLDLDWPARRDAWRGKIAEARIRLSKDPEEGRTLADFGRWYYIQGAWSEAASLLEKARKAGEEISPRMLANSYWRMRRFEAASRELEKERAKREAEGGEKSGHIALCLEGLRFGAERADRAAKMAADAVPITLGVSSGELREGGYKMGDRPVSPFRFQGEAGRWVIFEIHARGFDPACTVVYPDRTVMPFASGGARREARGYLARLPMNGTYVVLVHAVSRTNLGPFQLRIYYKPKGE